MFIEKNRERVRMTPAGSNVYRWELREGDCTTPAGVECLKRNDVSINM
jgi:hypothetical protein